MASVEVDQGALRALADEMVAAYTARAAPAIVRALDAEAPATSDGRPRRHRADRPVRSGEGWLLRFRANPGGGVAVHNGHGEIVPKRARRLRYTDKAGQVIYTKSVAASPGNPWMARGFQRAGLTNVHRDRSN